MKPIPELPKNIRDKLWSKVNLWHGITDDDCWEATGKLPNGNRPAIYINRVAYVASRIVFSVYRGSPDGWLVCHTCDNKRCVNPSHLFLGSTLDNIRDRNSKGRNPMTNKTHCKRGHEFNESNTRISPSSGQRICRKCEYECLKASRLRRKTNATRGR